LYPSLGRLYNCYILREPLRYRRLCRVGILREHRLTGPYAPNNFELVGIGLSLASTSLISARRYDGFKVVAYFCLGYVAEAAERGFFVYETVGHHPKCVLLIDFVRQHATNITQSSTHSIYLILSLSGPDRLRSQGPTNSRSAEKIYGPGREEHGLHKEVCFAS
jgi:hypothetical protein